MNPKHCILAVDDTPASLKLLSDLLKEEGYEVRSAINGELALHSAFNNPPDLVLLDIRMSGIDGYEVCRQLKQHDTTRDVPVIFVSAMSETGEKVQGFALGAVDFVTKPYQREELLARVRTHLELSHLRNHLEELVAARSAELRVSELKLRTSLIESITALAGMIEKRDPYTAGHQRRVADLAAAIAEEMGLPAQQKEAIYLAAGIHDVGKIQVPAEILSKPGRLADFEFRVVQEHAQSGYDIIKSIEFPWPIAQIILQHHERLDGSGYPNKLSEEILLEARIIAVADVVEAITSHRPYRAALGLDVALKEISDKRGRLYDPAVVDACLSLFNHRGYSLSD